MPNYGHLSLSCYIFERVNKGRKPPKRDLAGRGTRIPKGSVSHCRSRIHRALSHIATNAATFVSRGCGGYTLAFANRIAHNGLHGETGVFRMGALSLPSDRFARFGTPAWPGVRTANFAAFGPWSGRSRRTQRACGTAMRMMRVAVTRRRGPAGPRDPMAASLHRGTPRFCSTVITECGEKHTSFLCTELLCQLCLRLPPLCCTL